MPSRGTADVQTDCFRKHMGWLGVGVVIVGALVGVLWQFANGTAGEVQAVELRQERMSEQLGGISIRMTESRDELKRMTATQQAMLEQLAEMRVTLKRLEALSMGVGSRHSGGS